MSTLLNYSQIKSNLMHRGCWQVLSPGVAAPNGGVCLLESSAGLCPRTGLRPCRVSAALQVLLPPFLHGTGSSEIFRHDYKAVCKC